jgi:putative ABC transport system permease protein
MKLSTSLKLALNFLFHSKLRSWLTIIGIVIGVSAVVAIISIGEGMQQSVQARLGGLGADILTVTPGGGRAMMGFRVPGGGGGGMWRMPASSMGNLTHRDVQVLKTVENVAHVQGTVSGRGEVYYLGEKATVSIEGVDAVAWKYITGSELEVGRLLGPSDSNSIVIGNRIAESTFKQPVALNRMLTIEGKSFKVVGILKEGDDDGDIIMPIETARNTLEDVDEENFDSIVIKASSVDYVDHIMEDADKKLMLSRHVTEREKDYSISSAKAMQESVSDVTQTMTLFLGAIAAVSLVVGAVGIANTMFASVLEKTKEIGVMKAIGARNRDIMVIFLLDSALVGLVGGLLGIALGVAISLLLPFLGMGFMGPGGRMTTAVTPQLLLFVLLLSTGIGVLAGIVPTYRASKFQPVDALRYE